MATALLIIHGLVSMALLGAITHQAIAIWIPLATRPDTFIGRLRAVSTDSFTNAVVVLYTLAAILGGIVYLYFRVEIKPVLEQTEHWQTITLFDIKEHFIAIGLALLPAYLVCWKMPSDKDTPRARIAVTMILTFIVWYGFLIGHIANNVRGFGL